jgi:hypothetical protein
VVQAAELGERTHVSEVAPHYSVLVDAEYGPRRLDVIFADEISLCAARHENAHRRPPIVITPTTSSTLRRVRKAEAGSLFGSVNPKEYLSSEFSLSGAAPTWQCKVTLRACRSATAIYILSRHVGQGKGIWSD